MNKITQVDQKDTTTLKSDLDIILGADLSDKDYYIMQLVDLFEYYGQEIAREARLDEHNIYFTKVMALFDGMADAGTPMTRLRNMFEENHELRIAELTHKPEETTK